MRPTVLTTAIARAREASGSGLQETHTGVPHTRDHEPCRHHVRSNLETGLQFHIRSVAMLSTPVSHERADPPQTRMGTKRCREPSPDPTLIPEKLLHLGLRVISLKDSIRQIQRRVILLRLRKASADGILERIVQTLHECVEHAPPPALLRAF